MDKYLFYNVLVVRRANVGTQRLARQTRARAHTPYTHIVCAHGIFRKNGRRGWTAYTLVRAHVCMCVLWRRVAGTCLANRQRGMHGCAPTRSARYSGVFFFFYYSLPPVPPPPPPYPLVTHRTVHRFFRSAPDPSPEFTLYPPRHYATLVCVCVWFPTAIVDSGTCKRIFTRSRDRHNHGIRCDVLNTTTAQCTSSAPRARAAESRHDSFCFPPPHPSIPRHHSTQIYSVVRVTPHISHRVRLPGLVAGAGFPLMRFKRRIRSVIQFMFVYNIFIVLVN